jgi:hypothetical protein
VSQICLISFKFTLEHELTTKLHGTEFFLRSHQSLSYCEFLNILWNPKIYSFIHKNLPLVPILSQVNPAHITSAYHSEIYFNILSPHLHLALPIGLFPCSYPTKSYMHSCHHTCYIPINFLTIKHWTKIKVNDILHCIFGETGKKESFLHIQVHRRQSCNLHVCQGNLNATSQLASRQCYVIFIQCSSSLINISTEIISLCGDDSHQSVRIMFTLAVWLFVYVTEDVHFATLRLIYSA